MAYTVTLEGSKESQQKVLGIYGSHYFPRYYVYKKEAEECKRLVIEVDENAQVKVTKTK